MNFGDILDKWEKQTHKNGVCEKSFNKDDHVHPVKYTLIERRNRLLRKKPDAVIDLHGLNGGEAWSALQTFFDSCRWKGLEKVLIIHGKGNSSMESDGVLRVISRRFIESCSFAGESGYNQPREGGNWATWVILKN